MAMAMTAKSAGTMSSSQTVSLWVRSGPFTYGALQVAPHPRLTPHNLKKIVIYAKTKAKQGFPTLSYTVWRHIACNKLQLTEELAWMYFNTYHLVADIVPEGRLQLDKQFAKCRSQQDLDHLKNRCTVDTLKFVLLLYLQQLHRISLRASLVSSDEWPMRPRSPDVESGKSTPRESKGLDEHSHMTFLLNNLSDMLELLIEPDSYGSNSSSDPCLTIDAVEALSFLIAGSVERNRSILPFHEIALMQQFNQQTGFSKISRIFSFKTLQSWIRSNIGQNPFGLSTCIATGKRLSWPLQGEDKETRIEKRGKIATNAHLVPRDQVIGNKILIMSQVCKQTVARSSGTLEGSSVKLHRCHYSFIYLLSPLRSVSIEKCRHSTIVLGSVETVVHVNACEHLTVIVASRRFSVSGSNMCTFHLLTPSKPLILGGNDGLVLAPYHTFYGKLEEHMDQVGLSNVLNLWDQPLCVGPDHQDDAPVWELMSPREFYIFNIPFETEGPTKSIPYALSAKYQKALSQRSKQVENWQNLVHESKLSTEQRKQFQNIVENRFQVWLMESGHIREVDGLVLPKQTTKF